MLNGRAEGELIVATAYVVLAGVNTMPKPGEKFQLYQWLYDWTHTLLNSPMATRLESRMNLTPNGTVVSETKTVSTGPSSPPPETKSAPAKETS